MTKPRLSHVGTKMNRLTGVREIMKDIMQALRSDPSKKWLNLSPGNPLVLPELEKMWRELASEVIDSPEFGVIVGRYGMTQGYEPFIDAVVETYNRLYNWGITRENVLITPGTQALYFLLSNLLAGQDPKSHDMRRIVIPMVPDYTGYDGVVLHEQSIIGYEAKMQIAGSHEFKYGIDFDAITIDESSAGILCSRPCNPTGNILTDGEMQRLLEYAKKWDIPLIVDSAYAPPFPNLVFSPMKLLFDENVIHCVSLSKAGLPGERVGIAIGHTRYIQALEPFFSNLGIHSSRFGQALATKAFLSGQLEAAAESIIKPFYKRKLELFRDALSSHLPDDIHWYLHRGEGSLFSWIWIETREMNDLDMYQRLKRHGLLCVPGSTFFPGTREKKPHHHRCLRFSMTAPDEDILAAAMILGDELRTHQNLS